MQQRPDSQRALLLSLGVATFMVGLDARVVAPLLPTIANDFHTSVARVRGGVGAGFSLCHSTLQTRATEAFARARGIALALFAFSLFTGSSIGTVIVGYAADAIGYGPTFAITGVLLFVFTGLAVRSLSTAVDGSRRAQ